MRKDARQHRSDLIAAAARVFQRDGYRAPLEAVLAEADLGRGTLYRHFRSRHALIVAVIEEELSDMARFVADRRNSPTLLRDLLRRQGQASVMVASAVRAMDDANMLQLLEPLIARADLLYGEVIVEARQRGQVPDDFDLRRIRMVMRMVIGASRGHDHATTAQPAMEEALDIILRGIAPRCT